MGQGDREFTVTLPYALMWFSTFSPTEFFCLFSPFLPCFFPCHYSCFIYFDSPANYVLFNPKRTHLSARATDVFGQEYIVFDSSLIGNWHTSPRSAWGCN